MDKFFLEVGDEVKFVLGGGTGGKIDFTSGYHKGIIREIVPKHRAVIIAPSMKGLKEVHGALDAAGRVKVNFWCCQVISEKKCLEAREQRAKEQFQNSLLELKNRFNKDAPQRPLAYGENRVKIHVGNRKFF